MSRIGNRELKVPENVTIEVNDNVVTVKGPKGELTHKFDSFLTIKVEDGSVTIERANDSKKVKEMHGTTNALIKNMIEGVSNGFSKGLEILGLNNYKKEIYIDTIKDIIVKKFRERFLSNIQLLINKKENKVTTNEITLNHYPDNNKSRGSYLPLLELSVKESPEDDRNMHYLGREYMYYDRWNEAIDTLIKHLSLKSATWRDERCASMRFIARCYKNLNRFEEARMWLDKAILEAPYLRDPYMEKAILEYGQENWNEVKDNCLKALEIKEHQKTYINETFSWNNTVYDLLSIAYYNLNDLDEAIKYVKLALEMEPNNERLINNLEIMENEKN